MAVITSADDRSMFCPSPVRRRCINAAITANADAVPTRRSTEPESASGGSSGWPEMLAMPDRQAKVGA